MKRAIIIIACLALLLAGCSFASERMETDEIRAVWLSYLELTQPPGGVSSRAFRRRYNALFREMARFGICTVFVHVQPFSDAIWPSEVAPWSQILTGERGQCPGFDPLAILVRLARRHNLQLHAWFNLLRVEFDYFRNPAVPEDHVLLLNSVREVLQNYNVAGIHIDDYFYPTNDPSFDAAQFAQYMADGGTLELYDWRREVVNTLVNSLYRTVKSVNPQAIVSISPTGNLIYNYGTLFADVALWMAQPGFADWIVPQIYYGFAHERLPFKEILNEWVALPRHEHLILLIGLAAYKAGQEDDYAGSGRDEWRDGGDILAQQMQLLRSTKGVQGFALFSAQILFGAPFTEIENQQRKKLQILTMEQKKTK